LLAHYWSNYSNEWEVNEMTEDFSGRTALITGGNSGMAARSRTSWRSAARTS
jgi:hypothetical protein